MSTKLQGKVAIVTGGGSWIGKEIAKTYALAGAQVIILGRDIFKLQQATAEISYLGGLIDYVQVDISEEKTVKKVINEVYSDCGGIDILAQNAAIYTLQSLEKMTLADWQQVIHINLTGSFIMLKAVAHFMRKQSSGKIIFISSIAGNKIGLPGFAHYSASKSGLNGLMRTAAIELAPFNINVNSIEPGNIFNEETTTATQAEMRDMLSAIPLRTLGKPSDVAFMALFLSSEESRFITGQNFVVDGGETII